MPPRKNPLWSPLALLVTGLLSYGPVCVFAQTSQAVCLSSFSWMDNSKGQSPCLVTAYLGSACNGGDFTVPALLPDNVYTGPYVAQQSPCQCSSVFYNTISACGLCQNHTIVTWSAWDYNCSTIYPGIFSPGIPSGTAVPQWAYQDVTVSNVFNITIAQSVGDTPESTATHVQSTGSVTAPLASASASLTPTPSASSGSSSRSSNTGAIVGGVIGGVVGLALLVGVGIAIISLMKKKHSQIPLSAQFATGPVPLASPSYTSTTVFAPTMAQPRLYDPSDPSTFPTSPALTGHTYSSISERAGGYTGVPEFQR